MPQYFTFKMRGSAETQRAMRRLPRRTEPTFNDSVQDGLEELRRAMAMRAPYDPGGGEHLRNNIVIARARDGRWQVGPSADVPHAHLVELGTSNRQYRGQRRVQINGNWYTVSSTGRMPANPFMRRSLKSADRKVYKTIGRKLGPGIERHARRLG